MGQYERLCKALQYLVANWGPIEGRTRLMKLIYLADLEWVDKCGGRPYTEANYYRWNHGPFAREVLRALEWMDGVEIVEATRRSYTEDVYCYQVGPASRLKAVHLEPAFVNILDKVGLEWSKVPLSKLLEYVYSGERFRGKEFGEPLFY